MPLLQTHGRDARATQTGEAKGDWCQARMGGGSAGDDKSDGARLFLRGVGEGGGGFGESVLEAGALVRDLAGGI